MPFFLIPGHRRHKAKSQPQSATQLSAPHKVLQFASHHRIVTTVVTSVAVACVLGHHEMTWLILSVNYDKIIQYINSLAAPVSE
jgi:hypothetical protein